jgi:hypothetical protein
MPPNLASQSLARELGRPYHEVRRALNRLIYVGEMEPEDAAEFVRGVAAAGGDIEEAARAAASNQDKEPS